MLKFADVRGAMHYSGKPPTQLRQHRKHQGLDEETSCRPSAPPPGQTGKSSRRPERWQQSSLTSRGCRHLAGGLPKFQCAGNRELFKCVVSGRSHEGSFQNPTVSISPAATQHTLSLTTATAQLILASAYETHSKWNVSTRVYRSNYTHFIHFINYLHHVWLLISLI